MRLFLILFLLSFYCSGQIATVATTSYQKQFPGTPNYDSPSPLSGAPVSTTEIKVFLVGVGADSYVIERATDHEFSVNLTDLSSEGYNGTDKSYLDTGLSSNTTYYYRAKSIKSGYEDSDWTNSISPKTISFSPVFWWEGTGLQESTDNDYGKLTVNALDNLYSIVNTSGPSLDFETSKGSANPADNEISYYGFSNGNLDYWTSGTVTLTGDFTLALRFKFLSTPSNHYLCSYTGSANEYIRFQSLTTLQFRFGGSVLSATFPTALVVGQWADLVVRRTGTTVYVSTDGGDNWSAGTASAGGTWNIDTFFASDRSSGLPMNGTFKRIMIEDSHISSAATLDEFFNYESQPTVTEDTHIAPSASGVTWSDLTSGIYIIDNIINAASTGGSYRNSVISYGDELFIKGHKLADATYYVEDFVYVYDRSLGKVSNRRDLGVPANNADVHNNGSIFRWGNTIRHAESDNHYEDAVSTSVIFKSFGDNFNFSEYTQLQPGNSVVNGTLGKSQYHQFVEINDVIYCVYQEWNGSYAQWVSIGISQDGGNSWTKYRVVDSQGASEFVYPQLIYSEDKLRILIGWIAASNRYKHQTYLEADPSTPYLWTDLSGGFSQDVRSNNPINRTNSLASCRVGVDASALSGSVKVGHAFQRPTGELVFIQGNGDDDELNLVTGSSGGSFTSQELDFGVHSIVKTWLTNDGDNLPFAIPTTGGDSNDFDIYVHRLNGGNWETVLFTTTDGGVSCTFDSVISQDNTKRHFRMFPDKRILFADYRWLVVMRDQTTYGDICIFELD